MSNFDYQEFSRFTMDLRIDSKERGLISLGRNPIGSQQRFMNELRAGLDDGVRDFVILKSRQLGMSTMTLAIDLYWINKYRGINAALVTHDDGSRDQFRTTLQLYRSGLPEYWQQEVVDDNRNQLVLANGSRLSMKVAGTRIAKGGSKLGRSGALVACHMTETAFWGDGDGMDSLRASFAEHNPIRIFISESTANGFNHYEQMWRKAKHSPTQRAIFIGWWANEEFYALDPRDRLFDKYWGAKGRLTAEERGLIRDVKHLYGVEINAGQLAWYRYIADAKITDEAMLRQEFPWTEEMAFVATGAQFFRTLSITQAIKQCRVATAPKLLRVETGANFWNMALIKCKAQHATLKIWREPVGGAYYVIGCDSAYASSEDANNNVVSVWRVWYNRIEQVAEFADATIATHAVAWVMVYLAGYYGRTSLNLEVNGSGQQVLRELQNLRRMANSSWPGDNPGAVREVTRYMRQYLYRRVDSYQAPNMLHTKTDYNVKERIMNGFRDNFERGILVLRSQDLVDEMKSVAREGGHAPAAPAHKNDDRVVAGALAIMCWDDQLRSEMLAKRIIWTEDEKTGEAVEQPRNAVERLAQNYFAQIGIGPAGDVPKPKRRVIRGKPTWREKVAMASRKPMEAR